MKFLTEYLNSGSVKQQNKKRLGAFAICATAILLCLALIVLTAASIVTAVKNRKANTEGEGEEGGIDPGSLSDLLGKSDSDRRDAPLYHHARGRFSPYC